MLTLSNLSQNLVSVGSHSNTYIWNALFNELTQKWGDFAQEVILHIIIPGRDENAVVWLQDEVVRDVINNDRTLQITSKKAQVLDQERPILGSVLSIQPIFDVIVHINLVYNLVCILLKSCCEEHDFIVFCHQLNKLNASRSYQEETVLAIFNVVDQCFVQIKNKSVDVVFVCAFKRRKERWRYLGQIGEVVWEDSFLSSSYR